LPKWIPAHLNTEQVLIPEIARPTSILLRNAVLLEGVGRDDDASMLFLNDPQDLGQRDIRSISPQRSQTGLVKSSGWSEPQLRQDITDNIQLSALPDRREETQDMESDVDFKSRENPEWSFP
jgi:hypothetical protein